MAAYRRCLASVTCRLTAQDRDQLWNPTFVQSVELPFARDVRNRFFNFCSVSVRFLKKLGFGSE